jgi:hypothetical protein
MPDYLHLSNKLDKPGWRMKWGLALFVENADMISF